MIFKVCPQEEEEEEEEQEEQSEWILESVSQTKNHRNWARGPTHTKTHIAQLTDRCT